MKTFAATAALASLFATTAEARMWLGECPSIEWNTGFDAAASAGKQQYPMPHTSMKAAYYLASSSYQLTFLNDESHTIKEHEEGVIEAD